MTSRTDQKPGLQLPQRARTTVKRRGGALYINLPTEIADFLDVGEDDRVVFVKDMDNKTVLILNPEKIKIMIEGVGSAEIGFSVPKELLEKILEKSG